MNIESFEQVKSLVAKRDELIDIVSRIDGDRYLGVTFYGTYQDKEILDVVKPPLIKHLNEKRWVIEETLKQLGVTFS